MIQIGRLLMVVGAILFLFGLLVVAFGRIGPIGSLPGDFFVERGNFALYLPLGTSLLLSLALTLMGWLLARR